MEFFVMFRDVKQKVFNVLSDHSTRAPLWDDNWIRHHAFTLASPICGYYWRHDTAALVTEHSNEHLKHQFCLAFHDLFSSFSSSKKLLQIPILIHAQRLSELIVY